MNPLRVARRLGLAVSRLRHGRLPRPITTCAACGRLLPPGGRHACTPAVVALVPVVETSPPPAYTAPEQRERQASDSPATTERADDCPGCAELVTYLRQHAMARGELHCEACGASVRLRKRKARRAAGPRDDERAWRARVDEMLADLALVARWRPAWSAGALAPSPVVGDGNRGGGAKREAADRSDRVDERHDEMRVAAVLDQKLHELAARHPREGAVWEWIVTRCGRERLNRVDLSELVGTAFAAQRTVDAWAQSGDLRASSREHGIPLVRAAAALWCGIDDTAAAGPQEGT
jgi:hypothetical protein